MSQSVILRPDENGNNPVVNIGDMSTSSMMPVNVSYHESQTIQAFNAVSIGASSWSPESVWHDTNGYTQISGTLLNDGTTSMSLSVQWSNDGTNYHGVDGLLVNASTARYATFNTAVKARYVRLTISNNDTVAHTMSAWIYLMA